MKVPMATKLEGGGGGLWPGIPANSERIFFGFPRESAYEISELYEYDCLNKLILLIYQSLKSIS